MPFIEHPGLRAIQKRCDENHCFVDIEFVVKRRDPFCQTHLEVTLARQLSLDSDTLLPRHVAISTGL